MISKTLISNLRAKNGDDIDLIFKSNEYNDFTDKTFQVYWTIELEDHNGDSITGYNYTVLQVIGEFEFIDENEEKIKIDLDTYNIVQSMEANDLNKISLPFFPKSLIINCDKEEVEVSFNYK